MQPDINTALVVEGGAIRGVFSSGVLDGFLKARFNPFDFLVGVSSGAGNLAAYLAKMPGRNLKIYSDYSLRPEFINVWRFIKGGHLVDLDCLWDRTIAEIRLDLKTIYAGKGLLKVVITDVKTGNAIYKTPHADKLEECLKASSAFPILYRGFPVIDGQPSADGGIADPIPIAEAVKSGAKKIMVIRSRPRRYFKKETFSHALILRKLKPHPRLRETIRARVQKYNDAIALIRKPPAGISIIEICPPESFQPSRFGRNKSKILVGYQQGIETAVEAIRQWEAI